MKNFILLFIVILFSLKSKAQCTCDAKYSNNVLTIMEYNGANVKKPIKFTLDLYEYKNIKNSESFISWRSNINSPENTGYLLANKGCDKVILYINSQFRFSFTQLKGEINWRDLPGMDYVDESMGEIYIYDNKISMVYFIKLQNEYGNYIIKKFSYSSLLGDNGYPLRESMWGYLY
jgi:hypothetical protein